MIEHLTLFILWILFFVLHSMFAAISFKAKAHKLLKSNYKYYRVMYSLFALAMLTAILVYSFYVDSFLLWSNNLTEQIFSIALIVAGLTIMSLFTKKFFFDLSGADAFKQKQTERELFQSDFYKHVRHPLYSATLVFIWGIFLFSPLMSNLISCTSITIYTVAGIYLEEKKLLIEFGDNYESYRSKTPMLIPKLFRAK